MTQLQMFEATEREKARHGAIWWAGSWECRNFHGYFQSREGGEGKWLFQIYAFGEEDCSVYALDTEGQMTQLRVPIDPQNRITVLGRKYARNSWAH